MTLYMERNAFSWGRRLPLTEKNGHTRYTLISDPYGPRKQLQVLDLAAEKAVSVQQSFPSLFPRYEIEVYGKPVGAVQKDLRFTPPQYTIERPGWTMDGSVSRCDYTLLRDNTPLASCHPMPEKPGYLTLEFHDRAETLPALGVMMIINCVLTFQAPPTV